jgi:hypothetical protein
LPRSTIWEDSGENRRAGPRQGRARLAAALAPERRYLQALVAAVRADLAEASR